MKFMLDTNICIYIIKRKPPDVIERFYQTEISQIGISSITLSELLYGVSKSSKPEQNQLALMQFIAPYFPHIKNAIFSNLFLLRSRVPVYILLNIQQTQNLFLIII